MSILIIHLIGLRLKYSTGEKQGSVIGIHLSRCLAFTIPHFVIYAAHVPVALAGNYCVASSAVDGKKYGFAVTLPCEYIGVQYKKKFEVRKEIFMSQGIVVEE